MPGVALRIGKDLWWAEFETSLIWLTESDPDRRFQFLGSQLGGFFMIRPLEVGRGELAAGLGLDFYPLWNIHGDERQLALALRAAGRVRMSPHVGLFATARAYPLGTRGVQLGVHRDRTHGLPILFGTGAEWWF